MFPEQISFLPALRYYAGNWASSVWCFRDGVEDKIDADVIKSSALTAKQIAELYDPATAEIWADKSASLPVPCTSTAARSTDCCRGRWGERE